MQTRTYQLYSTSGQANAANRTIIAPGYISLIIWAIQFNSVTDNDYARAELSFQSISQHTVDNAMGVLDAIEAYSNFVTSGLSQPTYNKNTAGLYIPVGVGQILYMNTALGGSGAGSFKSIVHVIEK